MRSRPMLRAVRPAHVGAGVALLAIPASAVALAAGPRAAAQSTIGATLSASRAAYGHTVTVSGGPLSAAGGERLSLQFRPAGGSSWRDVAQGVASRTGTFRFALRAGHSGQLRVVPAAVVRDAEAGSTAGGLGPSAPQDLTVGSRFQLAPRTLTVLGGGRAVLGGRLLPAVAGRRVVVLAWSGGRWQPVAAARTGPHGGFTTRLGAPAGAHRRLQVRFAGDALNAGTRAPAGTITVAVADVASWYDDGGATACGFHAQYGVANRTLPCGTQVTFTVGGRSVRATVDDRGPFVGGRNWDLNQNTAAALGFGGVGTVWVSL